MADDEAASSALSTALRDLGRHLAAAIRAATGAAVTRASAYAMRVVLLLTAIAVSTAIGIIVLARGLHTLVLQLVGSGWVADLMLGIILIAWPLAVSAIMLRRVRQRSAHPPAPPRPAR